ncbi:MAG: IS66 family transposase [Candidatus Omnitrophica bacterium]|nr:IS66 family transposase [Candidatus Omnitrophota bacterium]
MSWFANKKRLRQLEEENTQLRQDKARLESRVAQLQAQNARLLNQLAAARKPSANSSKPPSSDIVKPKGQRRKKKSKRRIGAQKGHPKHERPAFSADQVDQRVPFRLERCPVDPSHRISPAEGPEHQRTLQQIELVANPFKVLEYTAYSIWCHDCGRYHQAPLPKHIVKAGLFGPRLTSLAVYLKGKIHASYSGIRDFFQDVVGLTVSRGYVAKLLHKASQAFAGPYENLIELLPQQTRLNSDETGHKENGQRYWIWCLRAASFVVFKIDPSRGTQVLMRILGQDFKGILGCDYYAAYRKYARQCSVLVQFCLAHLIRDVKYLCEFPDLQVQRYGKGLLAGLRALFWTLHRKDQLSAPAFEIELNGAHEQIWRAAIPSSGGPFHRLIHNLAERFYKHGEAYFQFITTPAIDPTNNVVKQAMRFVVIDRHITQGTRSVRGRQICERLWTVLATCALHKRSPFQWIYQAISAYFKGSKAPSLIPDSS